MSLFLRRWFLAHFVLAVVLGAPLWLIPGHALTAVGWVPESVLLPESDLAVPGVTFSNPIFVRLVGAGLLALAGASLWAWRARAYWEVRVLVKLQLGFSLLASLAFLAGRIRSTDVFPPIAWFGLSLCLLLSLFWGGLLIREDRAQRIRSESSSGDPGAVPAGWQRSPIDYAVNLEETVTQIQNLAGSVAEPRLREQLLDQVAALNAIVSVVKMSGSPEGAVESRSEKAETEGQTETD